MNHKYKYYFGMLSLMAIFLCREVFATTPEVGDDVVLSSGQKVRIVALLDDQEVMVQSWRNGEKIVEVVRLPSFLDSVIPSSLTSYAMKWREQNEIGKKVLERAIINENDRLIVRKEEMVLFEVPGDGNCAFYAMGVSRESFRQKLELFSVHRPELLPDVFALIEGELIRVNGKVVEGSYITQNNYAEIFGNNEENRRHYLEVSPQFNYGEGVSGSLFLVAKLFHLNVYVWNDYTSTTGQEYYQLLARYNEEEPMDARTVHLYYDKKHYRRLVPVFDFDELGISNDQTATVESKEDRRYWDRDFFMSFKSVEDRR